MKWVLGLLTLALAALALEDKGREVAGNAREAYGEVADQARVATKTLLGRRWTDSRSGTPGHERPWLRPGSARATPVITRNAILTSGEPMPSNKPEKLSNPKTPGGGKSNALKKPLQPSKELAAVVGPGALSRAKSSARSGTTFGCTTAEPAKPPRDPGRRHAQQGVRQGEGDHVRDEQVPGPAPQVTAPLPARGSSNACPAGSSVTRLAPHPTGALALAPDHSTQTA